MFDIGFTEIVVIAVIALFVIGPERLPETVREISLWIGRIKRSLRETRLEIEQQLGADEIRRTLHNENVLQSLQHIKKDVEDTLNQKVNFDQDSLDQDSGLVDEDLPPHDPNNDVDDDAPAQQTADETDPEVTSGDDQSSHDDTSKNS